MRAKLLGQWPPRRQKASRESACSRAKAFRRRVATVRLPFLEQWLGQIGAKDRQPHPVRLTRRPISMPSAVAMRVFLRRARGGETYLAVALAETSDIDKTYRDRIAP